MLRTVAISNAFDLERIKESNFKLKQTKKYLVIIIRVYINEIIMQLSCFKKCPLKFKVN